MPERERLRTGRRREEEKKRRRRKKEKKRGRRPLSALVPHANIVVTCGEPAHVTNW